MDGLPLLKACSTGDLGSLKKFLKKHKQKWHYESFDNHKWGPLHHAVAANSYSCVQLLLSSQRVDSRLKSYEGQTCLFVAIDRDASSYIIKLLLKHNPDLFNLPNNENVYPIHRAVLKKSLEIVRTMIETLNEVGYQIMDQFDWEDENSLFLAVRNKDLEMIDYLIKNIKFDFKRTNEVGLDVVSLALHLGGDGTQSDSVQIIQKLIPLCYDTDAAYFMEQLLLPISFSCQFENGLGFDFFMQRWYLTDSNKHCDLVQRALRVFKSAHFDYKRIIIGLHSGISRFLLKGQNKNLNLYRNIFTVLQHMYKLDRNIFAEIVKVMQPKFDEEYLSYEIMQFIPTKSIVEVQTASEIVEMFDIMNICDTIDLKKLLFTPSHFYLNNMFLLFMPFSTETTADIYVAEPRNRTPIADLYYRWDEQHTTNLSEVHGRSEENIDLARFCMDGNFRVENNLKSLCRAVIRRAIFESNTEQLSHSQQLKKVRTMDLPPKIISFLLFNYTNHELK